MSTYFLLDPFEFPYYFYRIRGESIYVLSIVVCMCRVESTRDTHNYGQYIKQFPPEYDKRNTGIRTNPEENM